MITLDIAKKEILTNGSLHFQKRGRNEEVLERFFNTMIEEQNFDLSFYQWCRTNLFYKTIGDFYICTDKNLREQKEKLEELIVSNGYSVYDIELKKLSKLLKQKMS